MPIIYKMVCAAAISCSPQGYKGTAGACVCDKGYEGSVTYDYEKNVPTGCTGNLTLNCSGHPCHASAIDQPHPVRKTVSPCSLGHLTSLPTSHQILSLLLLVEISCALPAFSLGVQGGTVSGSSATACESDAKLGGCNRKWFYDTGLGTHTGSTHLG